jgi:hypothetical protein
MLISSITPKNEPWVLDSDFGHKPLDLNNHPEQYLSRCSTDIEVYEFAAEMLKSALE